MDFKTKNFDVAYDAYYTAINSRLKDEMSILEIGGGAHPSVKDRTRLNYYIVDPDQSELNKAPDDIIKIKGIVQDLSTAMKFDLIISKMVLEHVENPNSFHSHVLNLLNPDGKVIHFFAGRHSIPSLVNRMLPEYIGDSILKLLKNRDLNESPKYIAYYRKTLGHTEKQISYFRNLGYEFESYYSFVGHKYLRSIPILGYLEKVYSKFLTYMNVKKVATVALVILKKNKK